MKNLIKKPYQILWLFIPILIIVSLFQDSSPIDLQFHNSYLVILPFHFSIFWGIILGVFGGLYWIVRRKALISWLTRLHLGVTLTGILVIYMISFFPSNGLFLQYRSVYFFIFFTAFFWLIAQVLFVIHLLVVLFWK
jgi:heme/copper-type cytochrome/quinol oxidase subunit 1